MRLRWAVIALALAALAGCGKDGDVKKDATGADSTTTEIDTSISPDSTTTEVR